MCPCPLTDALSLHARLESGLRTARSADDLRVDFLQPSFFLARRSAGVGSDFMAVIQEPAGLFVGGSPPSCYELAESARGHGRLWNTRRFA
jgi:hypothetical protein